MTDSPRFGGAFFNRATTPRGSTAGAPHCSSRLVSAQFSAITLAFTRSTNQFDRPDVGSQARCSLLSRSGNKYVSLLFGPRRTQRRHEWRNRKPCKAFSTTR
jgi:hypothetical protein